MQGSTAATATALLLLLLLLLHSSHHSDAAKLGSTCCHNVRPSCSTRIQPANYNSKETNLPFNRHSWLTTHNSFAQLDQRSLTRTPVLRPRNRQGAVTVQLNRKEASEGIAYEWRS